MEPFMNNKTVLITGASLGIGYELTKIFAKNGYNLVLVSRNEKRLNEIAEQLKKEYKIKVNVVVSDLANPNAPAEIFKKVKEESLHIDILVNNAGIGVYGLFTETSFSDEKDSMQINMIALTHLTKFFLKGMVEKGEGKILNVASVASFQPGPLMAVYYATKAYVLSFSEALASELKGKGVTVTALCPGPVKTGFQERANIKNSKLDKSPFFNIITPQEVAIAGYNALMKNKRIVIPGFIFKLIPILVRLFPRRVVTEFVKFIQRKKR